MEQDDNGKSGLLEGSLLWPEALIQTRLGGTGTGRCVCVGGEMESCKEEQESSYIKAPLPPKPDLCR